MNETGLFDLMCLESSWGGSWKWCSSQDTGFSRKLYLSSIKGSTVTALESGTMYSMPSSCAKKNW